MAVPIIIALVQAIKMTNFVSDKFAPLVSIVVGIMIAFIADHDSVDLSNTILSGVMFGLMASGLYSGISTTATAINVQRREKNH